MRFAKIETRLEQRGQQTVLVLIEDGKTLGTVDVPEGAQRPDIGRLALSLYMEVLGLPSSSSTAA